MAPVAAGEQRQQSKGGNHGLAFLWLTAQTYAATCFTCSSLMPPGCDTIAVPGTPFVTTPKIASYVPSFASLNVPVANAGAIGPPSRFPPWHWKQFPSA